MDVKITTFTWIIIKERFKKKKEKSIFHRKYPHEQTLISLLDPNFKKNLNWFVYWISIPSPSLFLLQRPLIRQENRILFATTSNRYAHSIVVISMVYGISMLVSTFNLGHCILFCTNNFVNGMNLSLLNSRLSSMTGNQSRRRLTKFQISWL